jgi:hypothetical protein
MEQFSASSRRTSTVSSGIRAGNRTVASSQRGVSIIQSQIEMESHADTTVFGASSVYNALHRQECNVSPYADGYEAIVRAATAVTDQETGVTVILVYNEAISISDKNNRTLVNPNRLRANGILCKTTRLQTRRLSCRQKIKSLFYLWNALELSSKHQAEPRPTMS